MSLAVVRCPACRGLSQVEAAALQLTVECPRCGGVFVALAEAELVAGSPRPAAPPPLRRVLERLPAPQTVLPDLPTVEEQDHDPHRDSQGGLPASVLIGLALLPFAIPILWLIAPSVLGREPTLSPAVPLALAVSTSILCLAVIYTIDWTPATRVKGVLMMVALAYFAAVNLYFLKKQTVDQVKKFFGAGHDWVEVVAQDGSFRVNMPALPERPDPQFQPLRQLADLSCYRVSYKAPLLEPHTFVAGAGAPLPAANGPAPGSDDWFKLVARQVVDQVRQGKLRAEPRSIEHGGFPGRELEVVLEGGNALRVVRVFLINGRVYYLSVESAGSAGRRTRRGLLQLVHRPLSCQWCVGARRLA
jgi:hypothetical protein